MSRSETTAEAFGHDASGTLIFDSDGDTVRVLREDASRLVTLLLLDLSPEERRLVHEMTTPECRGPCAHEARCSKTAKPLRVGDRVSVPRYPRGTVRGKVAESETATCSLCGRAALIVVDPSGTTWSMTGKVRKLR